MDIAVELSLYPLNADYIPPIKDFIDRLNADGRLKVVTNSLSTQVFGPYEVVFAALTRELQGHLREQRQIGVCHEGPGAADRDMTDVNRAIDSIWSGLLATSPAEALSVVLGLAYAVLAIRKSRWCWVAGGRGLRDCDLPVAGGASAHAGGAQGVLRCHFGVRLVALDARGGGPGNVGGHHLAAPVASCSMRGRRPVQCRHGALARPYPGGVAISGFPHYLGQPLRHLARGAGQARELAVLDLYRFGAGLFIRRPGACVICAIVCAVSGIFSGRLYQMVEDLPDDSRTRELKLAEALSHVPGYIPGDAAIEVVRLSGGSVNRSYSVLTPAGRFVLRLSQGPDAWLTSDRSVERELHRIAAKALIAPRIVAADPADWWMVTEYVNGRLWMEPDFANPQRLARLGDTLRRLHELAPPDIGPLRLVAGSVALCGAGGGGDELPGLGGRRMAGFGRRGAAAGDPAP